MKHLSRIFFSAQPRRRAGVTLVELMIAVAIITIGIAGLVQSFGFIQKAAQASKNKTLASNLAQEKMQIIKQKSYYQVLVTSDPAYNNTDFTPEVLAYDIGYFPPEQIIEAGVTYTRYTYIQSIREDSGVLGDLAPNQPDTGMKRITVTVAWGQGTGRRKLSLRSIIANPDTVMANVAFTGTVLTTATSPAPIGGALVGLVEASGCSDTTNSLGQYYINATPGTYTLIASATGYYTALRPVVIAPGATQINTFNLAKIATGRVEGYPWLIDHPVISQIVGSTCTTTSCLAGYDQEYIEIFNPTTFTWTANGNLGLKFQRGGETFAQNIKIEYFTTDLNPGRYYLFANTTTVRVGNSEVDADAVWATGPGDNSGFKYFASQTNIIPVAEQLDHEGAGAIELNAAGGYVLDRVGWNNSHHSAPFSEGANIPESTGLSRGELYARRTSTSVINWGFGPAYDSNNNQTDFLTCFFSDVPVVSTTPHNSEPVYAKTVISGTPAVGAIVSSSDGLSSSTEAVRSASSPPYAYFSLVDVATGSWAVVVTSSVYSFEPSTIPVTAGSVYTFSSTSTFLTQTSDRGIISGRVLTAGGAPLVTMGVTSGGANSTNTGGDGRYRLEVDPGTVDITVNPVGGPYSNAAYVTTSSNTITVAAGQVHSGVDFVLYQGARISGFITRDGSTGLPGVSVIIQNEQFVVSDNLVSGADGRFTSVVLSTGFYTVQPILASLETSNPVNATLTLLAADMGTTKYSSMFTVLGAMGYITGTVKAAGQPIKTGVLVIVTTATLSGTPPAPPDINSSTPVTYYTVSSMENGTYLAEVRSSTNPKYNVYAYYPTPSGTTVTLVSSATANVSVLAGATTPGINFSW